MDTLSDIRDILGDPAQTPHRAWYVEYIRRDHCFDSFFPGAQYAFGLRHLYVEPRTLTFQRVGYWSYHTWSTLIPGCTTTSWGPQ